MSSLIERFIVSKGNPPPKPEARPPRPKINLPPPTAPEQLPASWHDLPDVFKEAWQLLEIRDALTKDEVEIIRRGFPLSPAHARSDPTAKELKWLTSVSDTKSDAWRAALIAKGDEINRWEAEHGERSALLHARAGVLTLEAIAEANAAIKELAAVALQAFMIRISPLELSEAKARTLFGGSGLAVRYASLPSIGFPGNVRYLGEELGDALDLPLTASVSLYRLAHARLAEARRLLPEAKKELAKANAAAAKLGLS